MQDQEQESLTNLKNATHEQKQKLKAQLLKALKEQKMISEVYDLRLETYASEQNILVHDISDQERLGIIQEILFQYIDQLSLPSQELFSAFLDLSAENNFAKKEKTAMITSAYTQELPYSPAIGAVSLGSFTLFGVGFAGLFIPAAPIIAIGGIAGGFIMLAIAGSIAELDEEKHQKINEELEIKKRISQ